MKATDFYQVAEKIKSLNDKLNPLGFEIVLQQIVDNNALPQILKTKTPAVKGIGKYWAAINVIAVKKGITKAEAKEIYKNKTTGKTNEKVSAGMTKYWNAVRSVVAEKNISVSEARYLVKHV